MAALGCCTWFGVLPRSLTLNSRLLARVKPLDVLNDQPKVFPEFLLGSHAPHYVSDLLCGIVKLELDLFDEFRRQPGETVSKTCCAFGRRFVKNHVIEDHANRVKPSEG